MTSREERLRKYVAELEAFSSTLSAREKSLLNHAVLSSLATALLDRTVFEIARELQEIQQIKEKDLFQHRQAMINQQARAKERLLERQQQEIVQCQSLPDHVTVAVIEKNQQSVMSSNQDSSGLQAVDEKEETTSVYKTANSDILTPSAEEKPNLDRESSVDVDPHSAQELCEYVPVKKGRFVDLFYTRLFALQFRDMLIQTQQRFAMMSDQIMKKNILSPRLCYLLKIRPFLNFVALDDMGERLNHLESDINGLITQTMLEDPNK
ncbi:DGCR6 domain containing protein [Trichuris trichiura]|uniref:DGCR6 domain containing protein n=1 Tax=Trichuris trichiura TaxID=36087 RepID=A0A077ZGA7_TRITR|nr:DGCR6 domain containing protein [Trichuris trichiura]